MRGADGSRHAGLPPHAATAGRIHWHRIGLPVQRRALSPGLIWLMTITCTVTVANLYYAQPLLHAIGAALHVSQTAASLLVTSGQVGYAAGLLLVVPIGDITRRRPLLAALLAVDTLALAASAIAPDLAVLAGAP